MTDEQTETTLIMERAELMRLIEITSPGKEQRVTAEIPAVTLEELLEREVA